MSSIKHQLFILLIGLFAIVASADDKDDIKPFSDGELQQILAPIALYPDTVLSHILVASTYPLEVIQAERWTSANEGITGSDAVEAVEDKEWDPSVKALVAFPDILKRLSENLEWTQNLGDAFLQDEERLLSSIQDLRQKAYEAGSLDKMEKVKVSHEDSAIIIEPIQREVVYVPYYDTRVVYGPWYWSHYPPVYWRHPHYAYHGHHSPFYWGSSIHISFGFHFSSLYWYDRHLVRIPRQYYHPRRYYSRHEIVRHQNVRRWAHNPVHRRGVSYRSVSVSNRYHSTRPSRVETRAYRDERVSRNHQVKTAANSNNRNSRVRKEPKSNHRIASPERIRKELRDGKISIKERSSRPANNSTSTARNTKERSATKERQLSNEPRRSSPTRNERSRENTKNNREQNYRAPVRSEKKPSERRSENSSRKERSSFTSRGTSNRSSSRETSRPSRSSGERRSSRKDRRDR